MIRSEVTRDRWEAELRKRGCTPADGIPSRPSGEFWRYPTKGLYPFFVSYDENQTMDGWALKRLVDSIKEMCPDA